MNQNLAEKRAAALAALEDYRHALAYEVETLDAAIREMKGEPPADAMLPGLNVGEPPPVVLPDDSSAGVINASAPERELADQPPPEAGPEPGMKWVDLAELNPDPPPPWAGKGRKSKIRLAWEKRQIDRQNDKIAANLRHEARPRSRNGHMPINPNRIAVSDETPTLSE